MKTHLKIKIKSLAAEAVIIKREEKRWPKRHPLRADLRAHRLQAVRTECRAALLAYGYLRGRAHLAIEPKCHEPPNWKRVGTLIAKYGPEGSAAGLDAWRAAKPVAKAA